jgi:hypothetical protein
VNKLLVGIILGILTLSASNWAFASRSHASAPASRTLAQRVAKLEKMMRIQLRINRLTQAQLRLLGSRLNGLGISTRTAIAFGTADSNGSAGATAYCGSDQIVGGGAEFLGTKYVSDQIIYSTPNGNGWSAAGDGPYGGRTFEVYAVCASL